MRLLSMRFDSDEDLAEVDVTMSASEAALILRFVGKLTDPESEAILAVPHGAHHDIYSCLAGSVFNRLYDDGVAGYEPKAPDA